MGALAELACGPVELTGWALQVLLISLVSWRSGGPIRLPEPSVSTCLLVVCLAWAVRLACLFALASDGFMYWIGDDALRWLLAWSWLHPPQEELVGMVGWMPATNVVHGIAMAVLPNALYASKLVSASYAVLSLAGVFVFSVAVFRSRVVALVAVLLLAPFWIDILLSGGTMTEMPTVGAMLGGTGVLIHGLRLPAGRTRSLTLLSSAVCFALATTFHMVAWIQLAGILLFVLPIYLRSATGDHLPRRLLSWALFSAASMSWCLVWAVEQWISAGSPFAAFQHFGALGGFESTGTSWAVFPVSLFYCTYYYWPLVLFGVLAAFRRSGRQARTPRLVLACLFLVLAMFVILSVAAGAGLTPVRTVLALSAALLPFAVAPFFVWPSTRAPEDEPPTTGPTPRFSRHSAPTVAVFCLVLVANAAANYGRIDSELPEPEALRNAHRFERRPADLHALGSWMRVELKAPGNLSRENLSHPFELSLAENVGGARQIRVEYHVGDPGRFARPYWQPKAVVEPPDSLVANLVPGQVLISDYEINLPELRLIAPVGLYRVYERRAP